MQERNIPLFYKFLSAAIRQAAECHTERDTIKASTFHSQFHHWGRSSRPSAPEPRTELVAAWPGLRAERLPPVPEDALVQPILEHLRDVVTGPEHLDFCTSTSSSPGSRSRCRTRHLSLIHI